VKFGDRHGWPSVSTGNAGGKLTLNHVRLYEEFNNTTLNPLFEKKCKFALMWSISSGDQSESLNTASVLWFPWIVSLPKRPRRARARVQLSMFVFKPMLN